MNNYAPAPTFSIESRFGMADMGSLVHSRERGKRLQVLMFKVWFELLEFEFIVL